MSYDYNALVAQFQVARRAAANPYDDDAPTRQQHWRTAVETAQKLLNHHCPLTPLLWMQYGAAVHEYCVLSSGSRSSSAEEGGHDDDDDDDADNNSKDDDAHTRQAAAALETARALQLDVLRLAVREFPGSALLRLRLVQLQLLQQRQPTDDDPSNTSRTVATATATATVKAALAAVGRGSHRNEDAWVVALYRLLALLLVGQEETNNNNNKNDDALNENASDSASAAAAQVWIQRSQTPMREANDQLASEFAAFWNHFCGGASSRSSGDLRARLEEGRRCEARWFGRFATLEDDVDVALHRDGVLARVQPEFASLPGGGGDNDNDNHEIVWEPQALLRRAVDWEAVLRHSDPPQYGMGLGGAATAAAFVKYAHAVKQFRLPKEEEDDDDNNNDDKETTEARVQSVAMDVYERGVAECPTVESLWLAYIRDLQHWIVLGQRSSGRNNKGKKGKSSNRYLAVEAASRMQQVAHRACRNCPYSVALLQQKLLAVLLLASTTSANADDDNDDNDNDDEQDSTVAVVVDPDQLLEDVQKGLDAKFLPKDPAVFLDLYLTAVRVVKRRILFLLASRVQPATAADEHPTKGKKAKKQPTTRQLAYDDSEPMPNPKNGRGNSSNKFVVADEEDDDALQEVQDLLEDLGDMYDEVESRLRKAHGSWTEGRALLWKERAQTMALLQDPLRKAFRDGAESPASSEQEEADALLQSFEQCVRFHNPPHPDLYALYIRQYMTMITTTPVAQAEEVLVQIRRLRWLYEKALHTVGKAKPQNDKEAPLPSACLPLRDYQSALTSLCNEWLDFERVFGSERSLGKATKIVEKKLQKAARFAQLQQPQAAHATHSEPPEPHGDHDKASVKSEKSPTKRKHEVVEVSKQQEENGGEADPPSKKAKVEESKEEKADDAMETEAVPAEDSAAVPKKKDKPLVHKVKVGKFEYPAHPFTVRVTNLDAEVEDMDLIDLFRPKCGAIVHAKIIRDKQHRHGPRGASKGWGLIQFEERESVEKALALDDLVGLREKLVKVDRSHMPAASLVPPGMHRVRPTGEGKVSKRNQKRREQRKMSEDDSAAHASEENVDEKVLASAAAAEPTAKNDNVAANASQSNTASLLSFRPRGVARKAHQKPRLQLEKTDSNAKSNTKT